MRGQEWEDAWALGRDRNVHVVAVALFVVVFVVMVRMRQALNLSSVCSCCTCGVTLVGAVCRLVVHDLFLFLGWSRCLDVVLGGVGMAGVAWGARGAVLALYVALGWSQQAHSCCKGIDAQEGQKSARSKLV
eukprot:TRINITY_DN2941_c0_g1_i4.p3 TRINITY_DN2941_c0_g1~~TRINITY_DN2941_c0_g1_i4.p3  ORF type:complete len:132 (-),score=5.97 TRINITY_DN2941_c0_g1_i4:72-467(-)